MEPTYSDLDESTEQFVAECLRALQEIQVDISDAKAIGIYYDQMLAEWLAAPENERSDPSSRINLIGVALGQHLVQFTPMKWVIATDDLGVELAVRGSGWLVYPPNAVAKRWDEREGGAFIPTFAREIISLTIPTRRLLVLRSRCFNPQRCLVLYKVCSPIGSGNDLAKLRE